MPEDQNKLRAKIIVKAWKDPAYKQKLLKNPKAALKEMGLEIPNNIEVRVVEDNQNSFTFVLPAPSGQIRELSDQELMELAGGAGTTQGTVRCKTWTPNCPLFESNSCPTNEHACRGS